MTGRTLVLFFTLGVWACDGPGPVSTLPDGEAMRTDSSEYTLERTDILFRADIRLTYTNTLDRPVRIQRCGEGPVPPELERLVGGGWHLALATPMSCGWSGWLTIEAGGEYQHIFRLSAGLPGTHIAPQFMVEPVAGRYRLTWPVYEVAGDGVGDLLPLPLRASNEFRLLE